MSQIALRQAEKYGLTIGEFAGMRLDTYIPDEKHPSQALALKYARARCRQWANDANWKGLMFVSATCGTGKTHLGVSMLREAAEMGKSIAYVNMPDYFDELVRAYRDRDGASAVSSLAQTVERTDVLMLDDVGNEGRGDAPMVARVYYNILNERLMFHRPTIITSRYDLEHLEPLIKEDAVSRITQMVGGQIVIVTGEDYRRKKGTSSGK